MLINLILMFTTLGSQTDPDQFSKLESSAKSWLQLRKQQLVIEKDWDVERRMLLAEIARVEQEKKQLTCESTNVEKEISLIKDAERQTEKMQSTHTKALYELTNSIQKLEDDIQCRLLFLPPFINDKFQKKVDHTLELSIKLSLFFSFIDELEEDAKKWHLVNELVKIGENKYSLQVLYCGLTVAYGVSKDNSVAGLMTLKNGERVWTLSLMNAKLIRNAITRFTKSVGDDCPSLPFSIEVNE